jgi:hypothetical protein
MATSPRNEYDTDFYAWTLHNAELIRQKKFSEIDIAHIAEELEGMGKSERRELASRLAVLIAHLLKWQHQPVRRGKSWKFTIKAQRIALQRLLKESPSLKYEISDTLADAYEEAILLTASETGLDETAFPDTCPFNLEQCLSMDFFSES